MKGRVTTRVTRANVPIVTSYVDRQIKFVCLPTTVVAFFSTTLSPKKSDKAQGAEDRYLVEFIQVQVTLRDQTVEYPFPEPPDNSNQKSFPS